MSIFIGIKFHKSDLSKKNSTNPNGVNFLYICQLALWFKVSVSCGHMKRIIESRKKNLVKVFYFYFYFSNGLVDGPFVNFNFE